MQQQISHLRAMLNAGLADSVEFACNMHLSQLQGGGHGEDHGECGALLELVGDALFMKREFQRSISYFRRSLSGLQSGAGKVDADLILKIGKCHLKLGDSSAAVKELEAIPAKLRGVETNMLLGKLYRVANLKRLAVAAYKAVFRAQPCAIEALQWLFVCGAGQDEITTLVEDVYMSTDAYGGVHGEAGASASVATAATACGSGWQDWIRSVVDVQASLRNGDHSKLAAQHSMLTERYPRNLWLMGCMARSFAQCDRLDESIQVFSHMRVIDPTHTSDMDWYALALFERSGPTVVKELGGLANDMLALAGTQQSTGWLVAALFCQLQRDHEKATTLIDKAIEVDPQPMCFLIQGRILLSEGKNHDQALIAFYQANSLGKDLASFSGLVHAHLALGKIKDATSAAKDAVTLMPKSTMAHVLVGQCLSHTTGGNHGGGHATESAKAYSRALRLDPGNIKAASAMAAQLSSLGKLHEAALCLRSVLDRRDDYRVRTEFAKVLRALGNFTEALEQLHLAAGAAPADYADAINELDQVESLLRAEAEEAMEDNEEEEVGGI